LAVGAERFELFSGDDRTKARGVGRKRLVQRRLHHFDRDGEAIAGARNAENVRAVLSLFAEEAPQQIDVLNEISIAHRIVRPDRNRQRLFAHDAPAGCKQLREDERQAFRDGGNTRTAQEYAAHGVKAKLTEPKEPSLREHLLRLTPERLPEFHLQTLIRFDFGEMLQS
jgi:hypothetical protein